MTAGAGFGAGVHAAVWLAGAVAGVAVVALPVVAGVAAVAAVWSGPLAKRRWRVRAWRAARRLRRTGIG